jgi:hypothetical protein
MNEQIRSAATRETAAPAAAADLSRQLAGVDAAAIVLFCGPEVDGAAISKELRTAFPKAEVIGCTTAGEFRESETTVGGTTALALGRDKVARVSGALARFDRDGVDGAIAGATSGMAKELGIDLRSADPKKYVGIVLLDGLHMREEAANEALGNAAPFLSFVGASAGDNLKFQQTRVFRNGEETADGAAILLMEAAVPFIIEKTCSFRPTKHQWKVTKADAASRTVYELDGKPVLDVYAAAVGTTPDKLDGSIFMTNPVGLLIEDKPWIRSPMQTTPDSGLKFYCQILEGMDVHLMESTNLVEDTKAAIDKVRAELGGRLSGGIAFNCILRRLEMDSKNLHGPFLRNFDGLQVGGFHTYGETWLGHINQTLTALWFA